jgi:ribonuclease R
LLVHRAIKAVLAKKTYDVGNWQEMGVHCSFCERRAEEASRDVESWLKTYFMRDKVGDVFNGRITHLANFGVFVTLDDIHIEGMVHVSELGEDYFNYRADLLAMVGERSGVRFSMGDHVRVKVVRADLETSKIDLVLAEDVVLTKKRSKKQPKQTSVAIQEAMKMADKITEKNKRKARKKTEKLSAKGVNSKIKAKMVSKTKKHKS